VVKQSFSYISIITITLSLGLAGCVAAPATPTAPVAPAAPAAPPVARDNTPTSDSQCSKEEEARCILCSSIPEQGPHYGYFVCSGGQWVQQGFCGQYDKAC
jgi:hypothetical protein